LIHQPSSKYGALHDSLENKINTLNSSFIGRFSKCEDNAFTNQQLDRYLKKLSIDTVLLTGINANACVLATALGALQHGYNITTSKDLIAGFGACSPSIIYSWFRTVGTLKNNYSELLK
jgi:nicotinamidase-related amidase